MSRTFRIGLFLIATLLFFSTGAFLIGRKDFRFQKTYELNTEFNNVGGLNNGAEVRIGGIHEGTVKQIRLPEEPGGKITVVMKLDRGTESLIKKDSVTTIKTEGLLGDKYIEISFGSSKAAAIRPNDTIPGFLPKDFAEQASEVADQTKSAVEAFQSNMEALQHNFLLRGFFERRGYTDESELTRDSISHLPRKEPAQTFAYDSKDIFDKPDDAKLKGKGRLDDAGKYLEEHKFSLAIVSVSTALGDTEEVRTLTRARAKVIRDYLINKFRMDDRRVKTIGLGKRRDGEDQGEVSILVYD